MGWDGIGWDGMGWDGVEKVGWDGKDLVVMISNEERLNWMDSLLELIQAE